MEEIKVVEVERRSGKAVSATFGALGIRFRCYRKRGGGITVTRGKPDAQVYDKNELWVPREVFAAICRRAAGILYPSDPSAAKRGKRSSPGKPALNSRSSRQKKEKASQTFRRPVNNHTPPF